MWDKILTPELVFWMKKVSGETEDFDTINAFIEHIKNRADYKIIVVLSTQWKGYDDRKQANIAIRIAGMYHASRFILMMDFLSNKFKEGKLK
ncbi:MAG: hypothetical protein ABS939_14260 [Psychrobacillus sp.]